MASLTKAPPGNVGNEKVLGHQGQGQAGKTEQKGLIYSREFKDRPVLPPPVQMRKLRSKENKKEYYLVVKNKGLGLGCHPSCTLACSIIFDLISMNLSFRIFKMHIIKPTSHDGL